MNASAELRCIICRKQLTSDRYELDDYEMDTLVHELGIKNASSVQHKYGSVPICATCFPGTGLTAEYDEEPPGIDLIQLIPLKKRNES